MKKDMRGDRDSWTTGPDRKAGASCYDEQKCSLSDKGSSDTVGTALAEFSL